MNLKSLLACLLCTLTTSLYAAPVGLWHGVRVADTGEPVDIVISRDEFAKLTTAKQQGLNGGYSYVSLPSGHAFVGKATDTQSLSGFFIQAANSIGGQSMAMPVVLNARADDWVGTALPQRRQFDIYIGIADTDDGALATVYNPQRNITGPSRRYNVIEVARDQYELRAAGANQPFGSLRYDPESQTFSLNFGPLQGLALRKLDPKSQLAISYLGQSPYRRANLPGSIEGWTTASASSQGFDSKQLDALVSRLASEGANAESPNFLHSLLVAHEGNLVVESYFRGYDRDTPHDVRSAGKTFAAVLTGALIQAGHEITEQTPISQHIAVPAEQADQRITFGDLLTHRSGLDCDDADGQSPGNENRMWQQQETPNLWEFIAGLDVIRAPGEIYAYCSGGINLAGAILASASSQPVLVSMYQHVLEPLGFKHAYWNVMQTGEAYLGGGAYLRPIDMLKIGQLYLDGGRWQGSQLLDAEWVATSLQPKIEITPETTGRDQAQFDRSYFGGTDGLAWHLHDIVTEDRRYASYEASGNGGQMIIVVPELSLTVVMTGGNYGQGSVWGKWRQSVIGEGLIPALTSSARP
ncbi:MAG: serine hydrolase domain-containing protein [Pseudomonadota bacterium]